MAANSQLVGVVAQTGEVAWQNAIEHGTVDIAIAGGRVVAAVGQSLYCCDYATGQPLWRAQTTARTSRASLLIEGDRVYVCGSGIVDCFDALGQKLWTRSLWPATSASAAMGFPGNLNKADRG